MTSKAESAVSALIAAVKDSLPSDVSSQAYDREKLKDAAYKLTLALESPGDTVQRVAYYVSFSHGCILGHCIPMGGWNYEWVLTCLPFQPMHTTIVRIANR